MPLLVPTILFSPCAMRLYFLLYHPLMKPGRIEPLQAAYRDERNPLFAAPFAAGFRLNAQEPGCLFNIPERFAVILLHTVNKAYNPI